MNGKSSRLPYFDALFELLDGRHGLLDVSFGRHVHWGYWPSPSSDCPSAQEFAAAAEALSRQVYEAGQVGDGQAVLDVGCGFGGTLGSINRRYRNVRLVGLNIEARQLMRARRLHAVAPGNRLGWVNADACRLPFADASFDTVLAVECIFHFPDRERFFREAMRVLRPGGHLALSDFVSTPLLRPVMNLASRWPISDGFYGRCDVHFGFADYRQLAQETGFEVRVQRDITRNTLPTYAFLRSLTREVPFRSVSGVLETGFAEMASRAGLLRYAVLAFEKPMRAGR